MVSKIPQYTISVKPGQIKVNSIDTVKAHKDVLIFFIDCSSKRPDPTAGDTILYLEVAETPEGYEEEITKITIDGLGDGWKSIVQGGRYNIVWILYRWKWDDGYLKDMPSWWSKE